MNKAMKKFFHPKTPKEYAEREYIISIDDEENLKSRIAYYERQLTALRESQDWVKMIIEPMAKRIGELIKRPVLDIRPPHDICSWVRIDFYKNEKTLENVRGKCQSYKRQPYKTLNVEPTDLIKGEFVVRDFTQAPDLKKFDYASIGAINGMNYPTVDITDMPIEEICKLVK